MSVLTERQLAFLDTVAAEIVPATAGLDEMGRERFHALVEHALGMRRPGVRRQFAAFLSIVRLAPLARFGARFERLAPARRARVLRWLQACPVPVLRKGFWGLKTLVFMGYYGREEVFGTIRYAPATDGNSHLHD